MASRGWRTAPGSRGSPPPSIWRGGSSALSARRDTRSYSRLSCRRWLWSFCRLGFGLIQRGGAQAPDQVQFGLEIDVMRQLQMLRKAGRLDVIRMVKDEFLVLRRCRYFLAEFIGAQGAVDQCHRHRLALALAKGEAIAAGELRRHRRRTLELVHHLAFGDGDLADDDRETALGRDDLDLDIAGADLAGKRMVAAIAALRRIA